MPNAYTFLCVYVCVILLYYIQVFREEIRVIPHKKTNNIYKHKKMLCFQVATNEKKFFLATIKK